MPEGVVHAIQAIERGLVIAGATFLVVGFVVATVRALLRWQALGFDAAYEGYRKSLGRVILIGLEVLVAATIIKTITLERSLEGIGILGLTILVRTIISWTTSLELNGRWPWQKAAERA